MIGRIAHLLPVLILAVAAHAQNTVELRSSIRLAHDQPQTLGAVALLTGPLVEPLSNLPINITQDQSASAGAGGWLTLGTDDIRHALSLALGERASMVLVRGGPAHVRRLPPPATPTPQSEEKAPAPVVPDATALVNETTVRGHIARRIMALLDVEPTELRLGFAERDAALLDMSTHGRVVDARPTGMGARLPMAVKVYQGVGIEGAERLIADTVVRVEVLVRQKVAVVSGPISRGSSLSDADLTTDWQWLPPDTAPMTATDAAGRVARSNLQPGTVLRSSQVESAVVIRRGDIVLIDVLAGSVIVTVEGRARQEARVGEVIEFEFKDDRRRTLQATVQGAGRAVSSATTTAQGPAISREMMR